MNPPTSPNTAPLPQADSSHNAYKNLINPELIEHWNRIWLEKYAADQSPVANHMSTATIGRVHSPLAYVPDRRADRRIE
jgi:hypothetical protein